MPSWRFGELTTTQFHQDSVLFDCCNRHPHQQWKFLTTQAVCYYQIIIFQVCITKALASTFIVQQLLLALIEIATRRETQVHNICTKLIAIRHFWEKEELLSQGVPQGATYTVASDIRIGTPCAWITRHAIVERHQFIQAIMGSLKLADILHMGISVLHPHQKYSFWVLVLKSCGTVLVRW